MRPKNGGCSGRPSAVPAEGSCGRRRAPDGACKRGAPVIRRL